MKRLILGAVIAATFVGSASAQRLTSQPFDQAPPANAKVVTFDSPLPAGFSLDGGTIVQGSSSNAASPAGDTTKYLSTGIGTATITADADYRTVGFYWGSIDLYNAVSFLDGAGNLLARFTGGEIPPANGDQSASATNRYVTYSLDPNSVAAGIRTVAFESTGVSFELDNVAFSSPTAVPEPATMGLFGVGLAGVSLYRRRRNRAAVAA